MSNLPDSDLPGRTRQRLSSALNRIPDQMVQDNYTFHSNQHCTSPVESGKDFHLHTSGIHPEATPERNHGNRPQTIRLCHSIRYCKPRDFHNAKFQGQYPDRCPYTP